MLIFYSGTDIYRLRTAIAALTCQDPVTIIDAADDAGRIELERALKYPSFFQEKRYVVTRNILANVQVATDVQRILERYDVPTMTDTIVIACPEQSGGRESSATKALTSYLTKKADHSEKFDPLSGTALTQWITQYCTSRQCPIDPQAATMLARQSGGDSWVLANELEKLCAYAQGQTITDATVKLLTSDRYERDDFELSNALAAGNKRQALVALWWRLKAGAPDQLILGLLAYSIRMLLARNDSAPKLHQAHAGLAALDRNIKDGRAFGDDMLFSLILDM